MRHAPPFIRFQGSPGSLGSPGSSGLILVSYHGTIIPEILHSLSVVKVDFWGPRNYEKVRGPYLIMWAPNNFYM